ncbi:type II toxin-antitoxin system death-on-curing family toxin [Streptomyces roseolus]|uniref:type II toxin-antitoxin system death-on-curing family toxin n=1 Tax=Streptomyces roseolus TaxID=67358 RepID=UPI003656659F
MLIAINSALRHRPAEIRDAGLLAAAATRPHAILSGTEVYPTIEEKAAAVLHSVVRTRPFTDFNKTTGWIAVRMMLRCQGKRPGMTTSEAVELIDQLGDTDLSVAEIVAALKVISDS